MRRFFCGRQSGLDPALDRLLVALACAGRRLLPRPAEFAQHAPHVAGVVARVRDALDEFGHPGQRPKLGRIPKGERALVEHRFHVFELLRRQPRVGAQDDLTCGVMSGLTRLDANGVGITSLAGIQNLTSLATLLLIGDSINVAASGNVTFVAHRQISFVGSGFDFQAYQNDLVAYTDYDPGNASKNAIHFGTSTVTWEGVLLAPYGRVQISGSTAISPAGAVIGKTVKISASTVNITGLQFEDDGPPKLVE